MQIKLGKQSWKGRVCLDAAARIEDEFDTSIFHLLERSRTFSLKINEIARFLRIIIRAGGNDVDEKTVQNAVYEAGTLAATEVVKVLKEIVDPTNAAEGEDGNRKKPKAKA